HSYNGASRAATTSGSKPSTVCGVPSWAISWTIFVDSPFVDSPLVDSPLVDSPSPTTTTPHDPSLRPGTASFIPHTMPAMRASDGSEPVFVLVMARNVRLDRSFLDGLDERVVVLDGDAPDADVDALLARAEVLLVG